MSGPASEVVTIVDPSRGEVTRPNTIHAVTNPVDGLTGAIHVYGGDFVNQPRSQWGPGPAEERPYVFEEAQAEFAAANEAWRAEATSLTPRS